MRAFSLILSVIIFVNSYVYADVEVSCNGLLTPEAADLIVEVVGYVRIGIPILLIILCASDLAGVVMTEDDKAMAKVVAKIIKRFIAAAFIFFVPLIVQFVLSIDAVKNSLNLVDDPLCSEAEGTAPKEPEESEDDDGEEKKEQEELEINCEKKGTYKDETYCAPNPEYKFGSSSTPLDACSYNYVQHDSSFPTGTKVYAAFDGKAEFIQSACNDILTGYGNYIKITNASGTYVLYAHLSRFMDGIDMPLSKTCPKRADGSAPCPDVSGCTKQNVLTTVDVKAGQLIGYSGNIGNSTGPHLHVEIHYQGGSCISNLNSAFGL